MTPKPSNKPSESSEGVEKHENYQAAVQFYTAIVNKLGLNFKVEDFLNEKNDDYNDDLLEFITTLKQGGFDPAKMAQQIDTVEHDAAGKSIKITLKGEVGGKEQKVEYVISGNDPKAPDMMNVYEGIFWAKSQKEDIQEGVTAGLATPPEGSKLLSELSKIEDKENKLEGVYVNEKSFEMIFDQIKKVNEATKIGQKIQLFIDGDSVFVRGGKKEEEIKINDGDFENKLREGIQTVLAEYKDVVQFDNEYLKMAAELEGSRDPVSGFMRVMLLWAAKYPGIADMLFYKGGFLDKIKDGSYSSETFDDEEIAALKSTFDGITEDDRKQIAEDVPANFDEVHASIHYVQKVLWPNGKFDYKGPAALAAKLGNCGETNEKGEFNNYYKAFSGDEKRNFVENPTPNSVVFFKYGEGAGNAITEGFNVVTGFSKLKDKKPDILVGYVRNGKLEFYKDNKIQTVPLNDKKVGIMIAFAPTETMENARKPDHIKQAEKRAAEKAELATKLTEDLNGVERSIAGVNARLAELDELEALYEKYGAAQEPDKDASVLEKRTYAANVKRLDALLDKFKVTGDMSTYLANEREKLQKELDGYKQFSQGTKEQLRPLKEVTAETIKEVEKEIADLEKLGELENVRINLEAILGGQSSPEAQKEEAQLMQVLEAIDALNKKYPDSAADPAAYLRTKREELRSYKEELDKK